MPGEIRPLLLGVHWHADVAGGLNRYLANLHRALEDAGLQPRTVVDGPAAGAPPGVVASGQFGRPFPIRLTSYAWTMRRAMTLGVSVVDAHFAFYAFVPVTAGWLDGMPLVVHFQGPWALESAAAGDSRGWRIAMKHMIESAVYRRAQEVVVLSEAFGQLLVGRYGVPPWRVNVVPPGVDLGQFVPGDRAAARTGLGIAAGAPVAVAVRRHVPRMGLDILIRAWSPIDRSFPDARLLIVGDGPERHRLERLAEEQGVSRSVRFLGKVDDDTLVRCYQAADVSVVPTLALEGFGLVVLESLACGTPPIVTDAGGLPEGVASLDPSLVVRAGDPNALSRRLIAALDGKVPDRDRCRTHAETYSWPAIAERHRAIYARAVRPDRTKLRVVYLDHCARLSGGELALLRLLPSLDVDAHVILAEHGPLVAKLREAGVSVEVLPMVDAAGSLGRDRVRPGRLPVTAVAGSAAYVARVAARLRRLGPDLVHTNSLKAALYGGVAARLASIPVVWHVRDRITDDYLPSSARRLVLAAARTLPAAIIANSRATLETLGRAGTDGVAIASPLGLSSFTQVAREGPLHIGIVGRLAPWKGQHVFLDAFAKAFPDGPEIGVIIGAPLFGGTAYQEELECQVAALALQARVVFRGFRENVADELGHLDVLVHASTIPEPFGQVIVEGMAAGLPVVAADAGGPAEIIHNGVDGLLYPPGDVDALSQLLLRLAADPTLRRRLGDAAQVRAQDFTAARIAPQVMAVYRSVVGPAADDVLGP